MINSIDINGKPYSFRFGMRLLWAVSAKHDTEFEDLYINMQKDYDLCLEIFTEANKFAVKKEKEGNIITADELEQAIDEDAFGGDGRLMKQLFSAFRVQKKGGGQNNKPATKKKTA